MKMIIATVVLAALLLLSSCAYKGQETVIQSNWGIAIPSASRELYHNSLESFLGDGPRYTVLEYDNNAKLKNLFDWQSADKKDVSETLDIIEDLNNCLEFDNKADEKVPGSLIPDFAKLKIWKTTADDSSDIYIFFDEKTCRLYIVEDFV